MKESTLAYKVHVRVYLLESELCSSFESQDTKNKESLEKFMEEWLAPQYFQCVKSFLENLQKADIPEKYYYGQEVIVMDEAFDDENVVAFYNNPTRKIFFRSSSIIHKNADFYFSHELGHKIMGVKRDGVATILQASNLLASSDFYKIQEVLADACGLATTGKSLMNISMLPELKQEGLKRLMLKLAWSI